MNNRTFTRERNFVSFMIRLKIKIQKFFPQRFSSSIGKFRIFDYSYVFVLTILLKQIIHESIYSGSNLPILLQNGTTYAIG